MGLAKAEHFIDSMDERPRRMIPLWIGRQVHLKKRYIGKLFHTKVGLQIYFFTTDKSSKSINYFQICSLKEKNNNAPIFFQFM